MSQAAEALELVPKEVFSEKWLATFREEYLAVFTRLRMLKDLAVFVETCSIPRVSWCSFRLVGACVWGSIFSQLRLSDGLTLDPCGRR
jgi:hypothetical protein